MVKMLVSPNGGSTGEASVRPTKRSAEGGRGIIYTLYIFDPIN